MRRQPVAILAVTFGLCFGQLGISQAAPARPPTESGDVAVQPSDDQELVELMPLEEDARAQEFAALTAEFVSEIGEDRYGGSYADGDGQLIIQTVGLDPTEARPVLLGILSGSRSVDDVEIRSVSHTWAELNEIVAVVQDAVIQAVGDDKLISAAPDVEDNKVVVTVTHDALSSAAGALQSRFGQAVEVLGGEFSGIRHDYRRVDADPHKGGAKLQPGPTSNAAGDADCTSGFAFRRWSDGLIGMTTAGHCGGIAEPHWNHQTYLGQVTRFVYSPTSTTTTDAAFIGPGSQREFAPRVWYGGRLTGIHWPVVGAINETVDYIGHPIVMSGANTGVAIGRVEGVNILYCFPDDGCTSGMTSYTCVTPGSGNVCGQGGDSGAPCFSSKGGQPNTVMARGTYVGHEPRPSPTPDRYFCTSITDVSAGLQASLVLAP